jgi:hypothetical protein
MENEIGMGVIIVYLAIIVLLIAGYWKVYQKAGKPGWAAIVPIYNIIVLLEIARKPLWWLLLLFIPLVSIIMILLVNIEVAKAFNKGGAYGVGLTFLPFIFYPMLGFGDAQYLGGTGARPGSEHLLDA